MRYLIASLAMLACPGIALACDGGGGSNTSSRGGQRFIVAPAAEIAPSVILPTIQRAPAVEQLPKLSLSTSEIKSRLMPFIKTNMKIVSVQLIMADTADGKSIWAPVVNGFLPQITPDSERGYYRFDFDRQIPFTAANRALSENGKAISYVDAGTKLASGKTLSDTYRESANSLEVVATK